MSNYKKNSKLFKGVIALAIAAVCVGTGATPTVYASTTNNTIKYENGNINFSGRVEEGVNTFVDSISYNAKNQTLSFVVPKEIPEGYKWFVHISGHEQFQGGPGVFHLFEDESYNYTWEPGKKYEYTFKENSLINCSIEVGMINKNISDDIINNMIVNIDKDGNIAKNKYESYEAVNSLINTINYDKVSKTISFTIPKNMPEGYKWFIHVSGHEQLKDGPVVFNALEYETYNYKWENGKTYTYTIKDGELINFSVEVGLKNEKSNYIEIDTLVAIDKDGNKNLK
ncbi:hypothetical protein CLPUN_02730 [Clostridium puniceum]|uniref:Uncharacterized protein n=1 Tax=Clostridium puniceum TaxID=29367 RepID=A0A1S8TX97_9CLOT|nr:hypothetical protein [Clostridium puniceum]OOM82351.1 hypothetical protein CLPUN_02730 [Clostridium puniceum]